MTVRLELTRASTLPGILVALMHRDTSTLESSMETISLDHPPPPSTSVAPGWAVSQSRAYHRRADVSPKAFARTLSFSEEDSCRFLIFWSGQEEQRVRYHPWHYGRVVLRRRLAIR